MLGDRDNSTIMESSNRKYLVNLLSLQEVYWEKKPKNLKDFVALIQNHGILHKPLSTIIKSIREENL